MFCFLGSSPGDTVGLNLKIPLYLGGVNQTLVRVAPSVGVTTGFSGCISQVGLHMPGFSIQCFQLFSLPNCFHYPFTANQLLCSSVSSK